MKTRITALISALMATAVIAQPQPGPATPQPSTPTAPAMLASEKTEQVAADLRALSRIAALAKELGDNRQVMLAMLDSDIEMLREKRADDTYRWASLQRVEASRVKDEKTIERVQSEKELREVTITASNAYRVEVSVPTKRNLVSANNRVYVRNVLIDSTGFNGKLAHVEIAANVWINPGDSTGIALPDIGRNVKVTAELGVESGEKHAVAVVALLQAKLVDDPASPNFAAVTRLLAVRDLAAARDINRGALKNTVDEALLTMPGEMQRRAVQQTAAEERRRQLAVSGQRAGAIAIGDATPDVVAAIQESLRLLGGTLQDQNDGRARLQSLIDTLQPKPVTATPAPTK